MSIVLLFMALALAAIFIFGVDRMDDADRRGKW